MNFLITNNCIPPTDLLSSFPCFSCDGLVAYKYLTKPHTNLAISVVIRHTDLILLASVTDYSKLD